jgi:hypothetical protein
LDCEERWLCDIRSMQEGRRFSSTKLFKEVPGNVFVKAVRTPLNSIAKHGLFLLKRVSHSAPLSALASEYHREMGSMTTRIDLR